MKNRLLWKLFGIIGVGTVILFAVLNILVRHTEQKMSFIEKEYQQQLKEYGIVAESIYNSGDPQALAAWLAELQQAEQTWAAVVSSSVIPVAESFLSTQFIDGFRLGRNVEWKIHLYFKENPIMDMPFADGSTHFLIQLPERMRPGIYFPFANIFLQIALPFILLTLLSYIVYRHVMAPLVKLESATRAFSQGNFNVRIRTCLGNRDDELTGLADVFDQMAERTSELIVSQRQLLADLSHELRTPLARLDIAIDCFEQKLCSKETLERLRNESMIMRALVEDALTLAWLTNEQPQLHTDNFDLVELIQVIGDDACFEYPDNYLEVDLPDKALLTNSGQRALGQALENIIRNAFHHAPFGSKVLVSVKKRADVFTVSIKDYGPGVPELLLNDIFQPFFQVKSHRPAHTAGTHKQEGFGLGLALAKRQVEAVGGTIAAENHYIKESALVAGLCMKVTLPSC